MALPLVRNGHSPQTLDVRSYARIPQVLEMPSLIQSQIQSCEWFNKQGLEDVFREVSPIVDYTGKKYELHFQEHEFRTPKYSPQECKEREITFSQPLYVRTRLVMKETGEIKEQEIFMGDFPMMTENGTFIINGAERVVVSQLVRSPGIYFITERNAGNNRRLCMAKLIPSRGAWLEFETSNKDVLSVKVDRKRKVSASTFLRALGVAYDEQITALFNDIDTGETHRYMQSTLRSDPALDSAGLTFRDEDLRLLWDWLHEGEEFDKEAAHRIAAAQVEFYRRLRPGEPPSLENSRNLINNLFFDPRRYDLGRVGRYKFNRRMGLQEDDGPMTLTRDDIVAVIRTMIVINQGEEKGDDIDHLGNRRVRAVGELVQNQVRVGLLRMERMVKEKMTLVDPETAAPQGLINIRPVVAAVREFFGGSQLSQFMDQTNPLAELTHKRRLSALGPGGLSRERASFDVRDVHFSHYGRICPIETPEGPNIGLLGSLASYARINEFGFIESPYRVVKRELPKDSPDLKGRIVTEAVINPETGYVIVNEGVAIGANRLNAIKRLPEGAMIKVKPFVAEPSGDGSQDDSIIWLSADKEQEFKIAQANAKLDSMNQFVDDRIEMRVGDEYSNQGSPGEAHLMDVSPMQTMSVSAALIPSLEFVDAKRTLMGSNMQRQAVPLLRPEVPTVVTGIEGRVARDSGQLVISQVNGVVTSVNGREIVVTDVEGEEHVHPLIKFSRTNQGTCFDQRPITARGDVVRKGEVLADSSSTENGELALGQNVLAAFMSWEGYNYEDAIIVSERLYRDDYFTSIHIERRDMEARETKLGPEEITRDIPNVGEASLRDLDERGIIRVGSDVLPGDILVGKVTPKGETELTAEEKLLRAIFGEKSRDVKDTSLRVPHGERGKVIDVKVLSRENRDDLSPGVKEAVRVWIAQTRKISVGDKMSGRHGTKGVVARILPEEDMPYLEDGTPVDIILNPLGVPSRLNLGQLREAHLGWGARGLNFRVLSPVFDGATDIDIEDSLARIWFREREGAVLTGDGLSEDKRNVVARWLTEYDCTPNEMMERLLDESREGFPREACLRLWLALEAGRDPWGRDVDEMRDIAMAVHRQRGIAPPTFGKFKLYDGRTGDPFDQPVTIGDIHMLKLSHLVEDKIHARSTGPYSMITQQPLGGKAQFGGQRFGEMEVWALEAYSAAYNLQEMLTVKSDDVAGRVKTYEAVVKGEPIGQPGVPESFNVLMKELQSLGLRVQLLNEDNRRALGREIGEELDDGLAQGIRQTFGREIDAGSELFPTETI